VVEPHTDAFAAGDPERVRVAGSYADHELRMRVTHMDPETGAFRLEEVEAI
jgi:hypothetical protein